MARFVKKYVAGAIPTPQEVADLKGKVNTLEQQNAEKDAKILQLEASDQAFVQSLTDDVVADALVERTIKASIERVDGVIGGTIKDVETLKDATQTALNTANDALSAAGYAERLANDANDAALNAHQLADNAHQVASNAHQVASTVADEQQQQKLRLDDLEADSQESGGNFDQLKSTGVLVDPKPAGGINFQLPQMKGTGDIKTINGKNIIGQPLIITNTDTGVELATVTSVFENAVGTLMVGYKNNVLNIMNVGTDINITITEK